jgi:hypothetical protein
MQCFNIFHSLAFSFLLPPYSTFRHNSLYNHVLSPLYIFVCVYLYTHTYIWSYINLCVHLSYRSSFHIQRKTHIWSFEPSLRGLTWCSTVPSIYLQTTQYFILLYGWIILHRAYIQFLMHRSWGICWIQSLAIVNSASKNMSMQLTLSYPWAHSFEYKHRTGIAGYIVVLFLVFLRNLHNVFHRGYINSHYQQQCIIVPFVPTSSQHLLLFVLLMIVIFTGVRWNLNIILVCIFFMVRNVEHFFIGLLAICTSFENCLFSSFAHLFSRLLILWEVSFFGCVSPFI